ncbi:MAG: 3-deoxy-7-phosphoheptulonate synthase [Spirochaetaceae bacterium]|jgi:3-deoxy-7-phosphoheptulonate synthase|nr:3-deoxy-7-phosphoheptulonate synthase [Spirochaetaceae bacterium]
MVIALKAGISQSQAERFIGFLEKYGVTVHVSQGAAHVVLGLVGDTTGIDEESLRAHHLVDKVIRVQEPYKMANRAFHPHDTIIDILGPDQAVRHIGDGYLTVMAGPCSVETQEQIGAIATLVKKAGAGFLRGGAYKPRSSPYSFQGLGPEGLRLLLEAKKQSRIPIITELMDIQDLRFFEDVDIVQIGARNMQNFSLLKELGRCRKPVLLKRGLANTITELLMASEYIMTGGNEQVILCERGIRSFDTYTRNILDLSAIPAIKRQSHLPVIVDPSHATGLSWMVPAMTKAAIAAGADGIIVEVHNDPEHALCDGDQSITPAVFEQLMQTIRRYAEIENKCF